MLKNGIAKLKELNIKLKQKKKDSKKDKKKKAISKKSKKDKKSKSKVDKRDINGAASDWLTHSL